MSKSTVVIDAAGVASEDEFWERYISATQPVAAGYFGCNLNAFWDAVEGGGPGYPGEVNLHFINVSAMETFPHGKVFLKAFRQIASESKFTKVTWED